MAVISAHSSETPARRFDIEFLRVLFAFGIVWFLSVEVGTELGYAGLVYFVAMACFFACDRRKLSIAEFMSSKITRIVLPWLFWWFIFLVIRLFGSRPIFQGCNDLVACALQGPAFHLWYLSFIFLASAIVYLLHRWLSSVSLGVVCAVCVALMFAAAQSWREESRQLGYPWAQYAHALPAVIFGLFLGQVRRMDHLVLSLALGLMFFAILTVAPAKGLLVPYLIGFAISTLVLLRRMPPAGQWIRIWSGSAYGIYFVHPVFLILVIKAGYGANILAPLIVFALSFAFVQFFRVGFPQLARRVI